MHIKRPIARLLLALMLLTLIPALPALAARKATVIADSLAVYAKAKADSRVLGVLSKGAEVTLVKVSGALARIKYAGKVGYVKRSGLKLTKPTPAAKPTPTPKPAPTPKPTKQPAQATRKTTVRAVAYKNPTTAAKQRTAVRKGTAFAILGEEGDFYRVRRDGHVAYVLKSAFAPPVAPTPSPTPAPIAEMTLTAKAVVYKKPSRSARRLDTLPAGRTVDVLAKGKVFYTIRFEGRTGYVKRTAFDAASPAPTPKPSAAPDRVAAPAGHVNAGKAETVIKAALAQLGKSYVYGTIGPNTFDCSGLTYFAYKQVSVSLAHSAQSVGYGAGQKVDRAHLQRGDIVCFNTISDSDQSDHVGIYLGGGQFVHASSGQARVVVNALSGYYSDNFSWGRRVLS